MATKEELKSSFEEALQVALAERAKGNNQKMLELRRQFIAGRKAEELPVKQQADNTVAESATRDSQKLLELKRQFLARHENAKFSSRQELGYSRSNTAKSTSQTETKSPFSVNREQFMKMEPPSDM